MGKAKDRLDSEGNEKIQCRVCQLWFHRMDVHVANKHGTTVEDYTRKYPGAPILSEYAKGQTEDDETGEGVDKSAEPMKFGVAKLFERKDLSPYDAQFVPVHDEKWVCGPNEMTNLEYLALGMQDDENVLIVGPPGVGKTTLARELAAVCGQPLRRLPFNGEMRVGDLMGSKELVIEPKSGQTITQYRKGPLPDSAENGHWCLFDEFDSAPPQMTFLLHSILEKPRQMTMMTDGAGTEQHFHKHFRVIATANTLGYGDDTGLYAGTGPMNEALLDRFGIVIRMDYPREDEETRILVDRTGIKENVAKLMVDVAKKVREAQKNQTTMVSLSPRRLIMWASKAERLGNPRKAAQITLLNKLAPDDAKYIEGVVQRCFGGK